MAAPDSVLPQVHSDIDWILLPQAAMLAIALAMLAILWPLGIVSETVIWLQCVFFTLHFAWGAWSWNSITGRWINLYSLFFVSLCIFNGGQAILATFGIDDCGTMLGNFSTETRCRTLLLVNVAVTSFHFTGLLVALRSRMEPSPNCRPAEPVVQTFSLKRAEILAILFLVVSIPPTLSWAATSIDIVSQGGYLALYQQELQVGLDNWQNVLTTLFVPGVLLLLTARRHSPRAVGICWAMMLAYALVNGLLGTRGAAVLGAVSLAALHDGIIRRIPRGYLIAAALAVLCVLPLIAQTRDLRGESRYDAIVDRLDQNPYVAILHETGNSASTVALSIDLLPTVRDYDYGMGYFYGILTVVPNLFWERHPSAVHGTYSSWLIWTVDPVTAQRGGGLGYSVIAEAYANFSILGPPLVLALLGFILARLDDWVRTNPHPFKNAMEAIAISAILLLPRAESANIWRPIIWFCVFPYLAVWSRTRNELPLSSVHSPHFAPPLRPAAKAGSLQ